MSVSQFVATSPMKSLGRCRHTFIPSIFCPGDGEYKATLVAVALEKFYKHVIERAYNFSSSQPVGWFTKVVA